MKYSVTDSHRTKADRQQMADEKRRKSDRNFLTNVPFLHMNRNSDRKKNQAKRILAPVLAAAAVATSVLGRPLPAGATNATINNLTNQSQNLQNSINSANSELVDILSDIEAISSQITEKQAEIAQAEDDIAAAEAAEQQQYEAMKKRMKFMYENGNKSIIEIFVESDNFADFLNRVEYTNAVYTSDRQMLDSYEATKIEIQGMKEDLESEKSDLESQQGQLSAKQTALNSKISEMKARKQDVDAALADAKKKAAEEAERKRKALEAEKARQRAAAVQAAAERRRAAAAAAAANGSSSSSSSSAADVSDDGDYNPAPQTSISGSAVVAYAKQFVGNPYVWGGNSLTNGIDCSGFVVQVYKHFGIDLSRSRNSASLRSVGQKVSYNNLQPGDIVCYPGHVGIYAGGGKIVEAQGTATGITDYRPVTCHTILAIRRVI